ncbi:MAG: hypothetical protein D6806_14585, partial [Deltaproteobacteria bacterium]
RDSIAAAGAIGKLYAEIPGPKRLEVVEGADHFFAGYEGEVGKLVALFFKDALVEEEASGCP